MSSDHVVEFVPRFQKQLDVLHRPPSSRTLFIGGVGYGKTMVMSDFLQQEVFKYPDGQLIVAGATLPAMKIASIQKIHENFKARNIWYDYTEYKNEVRFSNGSWYRYQSLDVPTKELEGSELSALLIDEITACPRQQVFSLLNRVRRQSDHATKLQIATKLGLSQEGLLKPGDPGWWDYSRRVLFCGNPPEPGHWLERAFIEVDGSEEPVIGEVIQASTYENVTLPDDYIKGLESQYPPGTYLHRRMMLGEFGVSAEGAIYAEYNPKVHQISESDVPWDKVTACRNSIDLGHGNKDAFAYLRAVEADGILYIASEYYCTEPRLMAKHAAAIRSRYTGGPVWCDWDAQLRMELRALGLRTIPANKDILMGIHAVRARLANGTLKFVRGKCPNLMREMPSYIWDDGDKPKKSKEGDHALDCLRYIVAGLDLPRPPRKRK